MPLLLHLSILECCFSILCIVFRVLNAIFICVSLKSFMIFSFPSMWKWAISFFGVAGRHYDAGVLIVFILWLLCNVSFAKFRYFLWLLQMFGTCLLYLLSSLYLIFYVPLDAGAVGIMISVWEDFLHISNSNFFFLALYWNAEKVNGVVWFLFHSEFYDWLLFVDFTQSFLYV